MSVTYILNLGQVRRVVELTDDEIDVAEMAVRDHPQNMTLAVQAVRYVLPVSLERALAAVKWARGE